VILDPCFTGENLEKFGNGVGREFGPLLPAKELNKVFS